MKKLIFISIIIGVIAALVLPVSPAFAESVESFVVFDGTPIYAEAVEDAEIVGYLNGGDKVVIKDAENETSESYYAISYNGAICYIRTSAVYSKRPDAQTAIAYVRATRTAESEVINIYSLPRTDSEVISVCSDGTILDMVTEYNDDFYVIDVDGRIGYVPSENVTTGVTYYQRIALIVGAVVLAGVLGIVFIQSVSIGKSGKKHTSNTTASFD